MTRVTSTHLPNPSLPSLLPISDKNMDNMDGLGRTRLITLPQAGQKVKHQQCRCMDGLVICSGSKIKPKSTNC